MKKQEMNSERASGAEAVSMAKKENGESFGAAAGVAQFDFTHEQIELIKRTVAKGTTDDELSQFMHICTKSGLDPLAKQIHAIKKWNSKEKKEVMSVQTGIDGYRLIAERTGKYAPGKEPTFVYDSKGQLASATAYVKKRVEMEWHEVAATAHFREYCQKTKEGNLNSMWESKPHVMLAKCAEAMALRRAFPANMSSLYIHEEMGVENQDDTDYTMEKPVKTAEYAGAGASAGLSRTVSFIPEDFREKIGGEGRRTWKKSGIKSPTNEWYGTFDRSIAELIKSAKEKKQEIELVFVSDGRYKTIKEARIVIEDIVDDRADSASEGAGSSSAADMEKSEDYQYDSGAGSGDDDNE